MAVQASCARSSRSLKKYANMSDGSRFAGKALRVPGEVLLLRGADRRQGSRQSSQAVART